MGNTNPSAVFTSCHTFSSNSFQYVNVSGRAIGAHVLRLMSVGHSQERTELPGDQAIPQGAGRLWRLFAWNLEYNNFSEIIPTFKKTDNKIMENVNFEEFGHGWGPSGLHRRGRNPSIAHGGQIAQSQRHDMKEREMTDCPATPGCLF